MDSLFSPSALYTKRDTRSVVFKLGSSFDNLRATCSYVRCGFSLLDVMTSFNLAPSLMPVASAVATAAHAMTA